MNFMLSLVPLFSKRVARHLLMSMFEYGCPRVFVSTLQPTRNRKKVLMCLVQKDGSPSFSESSKPAEQAEAKHNITI